VSRRSRTGRCKIDVATFIQWINAHEEHRPALAAFYGSRFRDEFKPAFAAWLAAKPFTNPAAPEAPFAMPQSLPRRSSSGDQHQAADLEPENDAAGARVGHLPRNRDLARDLPGTTHDLARERDDFVQEG
jgi:hypothetical protein